MSRGVDLPPSDVNGLADPYCTISIGSDTRKTSTILKSLNPSWSDPAFAFRVALPSLASRGGLGVSDLLYYVLIDVWDYDRLNQDDLLGRVMIPIASLRDGKHEAWHELKTTSFAKTVSGKILVTMIVKSQEVSSQCT